MAATLEQTEPSFEEAERIQRFWDEHYDEFLNQYPDRFVAISPTTGEVILTNPDLAMLVYELRDRGLDARTDVAIDFVTDRSNKLLF